MPLVWEPENQWKCIEKSHLLFDGMNGSHLVRIASENGIASNGKRQKYPSGTKKQARWMDEELE
jgi:hypothetical protein